MNGIINVYKEKNYTSHDVVAKLRGILRQKKIGHTGTLDPQAEGVLPVCLGNATKLCDLLTDKTKEYEAVLRLGVTTDTQDMTGEVLDEKPVTVTEDRLREIMMGFVGKGEQIPPMYSAIKVNGRRLYELAREGREVERKPRPIEIYHIDIKKINLPMVTFRVSCSKGTYIRTLCQDIGEKAGCGGAMESLLRTRVDRFRLEESYTLGQIEQLRDEGRLDAILYSVDEMFSNYPAVTVQNAFRKVIDNGNNIFPMMYKESLIPVKVMPENKSVEKVGQNEAEPMRIRVYNEDKVFYGIYEYVAEKEYFKPYKMFLDKNNIHNKE